jgi:pimeloyl-ACP methyl ester carboxylesterase
MRIRPLRRLPFAFGWLSKRPIERAVSDSYVRPSMSSGGVRRDTAKFIKGISPDDLLKNSSGLKNFGRPVLLVWARDDKFFKLDLGERLAAAFPNARLEVVDDSRTFLPEDQPDRLAELIAAFAREPVTAAA